MLSHFVMILALSNAALPQGSTAPPGSVAPKSQPAATAPASQPAAPLLSGPEAQEDRPRLTLIHRSFDGKLENLPGEPDAIAIGMLDLSPEQRARYDEINAARMSAFDDIVRSNYGLILELASLSEQAPANQRVNLLIRLQAAMQPYVDRGSFYEEMWPHLTDAQRSEVERVVFEYQRARKETVERESEQNHSSPRAAAARDRLEVLGEMIRASIDRQVGLERDNFEAIAGELGLSAEQRAKAEAIYQPLAIKRFQKIDVTKAERSAAFAEFSKLLTAGQKQKLFAMLLRQYQAKPGPASQPSASQPAR